MEEALIVRELDLYARFISVQDELLFIAHFRYFFIISDVNPNTFTLEIVT